MEDIAKLTPFYSVSPQHFPAIGIGSDGSPGTD
jgi:hypothetical protein